MCHTQKMICCGVTTDAWIVSLRHARDPERARRIERQDAGVPNRSQPDAGACASSPTARSGYESRDDPDSCGMTWWQTLLVALAPAVVTALALIHQQRRADARESQRLKDERAERSEEPAPPAGACETRPKMRRYGCMA